MNAQSVLTDDTLVLIDIADRARVAFFRRQELSIERQVDEAMNRLLDLRARIRKLEASIEQR